MVKYHNFYYFLYIFISFSVLAVLFLFLKNKDKKFINRALIVLLFLNFGLHFAKMAFSPYKDDMPLALRKITPENICAVSAIVFPFFYLSKKKILRDYMYYMGLLSGVLSMFVPVGALNEPFSFNVARFYICHMLIFIVPVLMVVLRQHELNYKRCYNTAIVLWGVLTIILLNEIFLAATGFADISRLFDPGYRNDSFVFGPSTFEDVVDKFVMPLVPKIFTKIPFGTNAGQPRFWPVIWLIIPSFVYITAISFVLGLPFTYKKIMAGLTGKKPKGD